MARRWWGAMALGAVLAVLLVVFVVQQRDEGPDGPAASVFLVGDSITVMARMDQEVPPGWAVDARAGRTTPEGIAVVEERDLADVDVVVVALGTNDAADDAATYGARVDRMLDAIGPGPEVVWINVDANTAELARAADGVNAALDDAARRHPRLVVADWDAYVAEHEDEDDLRSGDGIHYGVRGSEIRRDYTVEQARR